MTWEEAWAGILETREEIKTWGRPPRDLSKLTPWQNAILDRNTSLINWIFDWKYRELYTPPSREEWRKTLPPRTLYEGDDRL